MNEDVVSAEYVARHLRNYGLEVKPPERVASGARVLGLHVSKQSNDLVWRRDNLVGELPGKFTRRTIFSFCGSITAHLPICGWLRPAVAYIKRRVNLETENWDEEISSNSNVHVMLRELVNRLRTDDPAKGSWKVSSDKAVLWVDASSISIGAVIEVEGRVIEDCSWLRNEDSTHINLSELEAVVKGINLAISWGMRNIQVMTDSASVYHWVSDVLSSKARVKTKASSEMLIRRRLSLIKSLVEEYQLQLSIKLVKSAENLADVMTRVPRKWLQGVDKEVAVGSALSETNMELVKKVHETSDHPGIRRSFYFTKRAGVVATKRDVREVVNACTECTSIDPAPVKWMPGELNVSELWERVAIDVTHYGQKLFLSMIDCGPSRFAIWRELPRENTVNIISELEAVFCERGPPREVLLDNSTVFRGKVFGEFLNSWGVGLRFRCAYRPSGNSIVERNHRSVNPNRTGGFSAPNGRGGLT